MIQNDSIQDFIIFINKNSYSLSSEINQSIYETNNFILKMMKKSKITLIEYAAFYGSFQIFQYLKLNNVDLKPSLWLYAIHGKNAEIIQLLENNQV